MDAKKYAAPQLVEYGRVEDITKGWFGPNLDAFTGRTPGLLGGDPDNGHTGSN
jgi:hypothetical protein